VDIAELELELGAELELEALGGERIAIVRVLANVQSSVGQMRVGKMRPALGKTDTHPLAAKPSSVFYVTKSTLTWGNPEETC
jgi:hypothetical protein